MNFKCGKCFAISSAKAWNKATVESYDEDIAELEDTEWLGDFAYTCPVCKEEDANPSPQETN